MDKCKIKPCGWLKSQIISCRMNIKSEVPNMCQKNNLVSGVKFR